MLSQYNIIENKSKKYFNGSVWESASSGRFKVIGKTDRTNGKGSRIYCLCKFEDGAIVESDFTNIKNGNIKSPNKLSVYGVGYMGQGKWTSAIDGKTTKEYMTWQGMIERCYSEKFQEDFPTYKGVTVSERWKCFQRFCEGIKELHGYSKWKNGSDVYHLDKDIICERDNIKPKIYSSETCMFITRSENVSESLARRNLTGLTYIGISPAGSVHEFTNQTEFAKQQGLHYSLVSACVNKTRDQHKGWTFKVKDELNKN